MLSLQGRSALSLALAERGPDAAGYAAPKISCDEFEMKSVMALRYGISLGTLGPVAVDGLR
jgi:hypothetical protein